MFDRGDKVMTPQGSGIVVYKRMDHLNDITQVASYCVILDKHKGTYTGTLFLAKDVTSPKE